MKILYHHRTRSKDGQNVHIEELTAALRRMGHEVIMVGPPSADSDGEFSTGGSGLADFAKRQLPKFAYELLEFGYALKAYRRLAAAYRTHRPDVLYERHNLFLPSGVWLKRKTGLPMLLEVNSPLTVERGKFGGLALTGLARWSEHFVWREADHVLPVTRVLAGHIRAAGVPDSRISVIPNGINRSYFEDTPHTAEAKRRLGLDGRLVLGFTGFVRDWHRLDAVVDMLAEAPSEANLHLLLVGDGPARPDLEARARQAGVADRLSVTGVVGRHEIPAHVAAFDIALQPAVTPYASPLKLFEYLYLGCAVVAPAMDNITEILEDGVNAALFDPDDPGGLCRAIQALIDDPARRRSLGEQARATIEHRDLTWDGNARRVTDLFERLLADTLPSGHTTTAQPTARSPQ